LGHWHEVEFVPLQPTKITAASITNPTLNLDPMLDFPRSASLQDARHRIADRYFKPGTMAGQAPVFGNEYQE
jgi:hypothetical protein